MTHTSYSGLAGRVVLITGGASGTGNGLLQFVAAPSSGAARTGSVTIAGQRYEGILTLNELTRASRFAGRDATPSRAIPR